MDSSLEVQRRQRVFRLGLRIVLVCDVLLFVAYYAHLLSTGAAGLLLGGAAAFGGLWMFMARRWVRKVEPPVSPARMVELRETHKRFVKRFGVLGFGLSWGLLMAVWTNWGILREEFWPNGITTLLLSLLVWIPLGLFTGWLWGRTMVSLSIPRTSTSQNSDPSTD